MSDSLLGIGLYTSLEASKLTKVPAQTISRWLGGYSYPNDRGVPQNVAPLWEPDLARGYNDQIQLSFRDLMEVRFVKAFRDSGLSLQNIRLCFSKAQEIINADRPFSTAQFHTDGKTIFLEKIVPELQNSETVDLKNFQSVFKTFISPTFKDID